MEPAKGGALVKARLNKLRTDRPFYLPRDCYVNSKEMSMPAATEYSSMDFL